MTRPTVVGVASDTFALRSVIRGLSDPDYALIAAATIRSAIDLLSTTEVDLLLVEGGLGDAAKSALVAEAARRSPRTKVLFVSSAAMDSAPLRGSPLRSLVRAALGLPPLPPLGSRTFQLDPMSRTSVARLAARVGMSLGGDDS